MTPDADLRARVFEAVHQEPAATRSQRRVRDVTLLVSAAAVPVVVFVMYGAVRATGRPSALIVETAGAAASVALVALIIGLGRGRSMLGRAGVLLLGLALLTPLALLGLKTLISSQYLGMAVEWPTRPGFRCLRLSGLMAAWPLAALVMARRGTDPIHPALAGAAIGTAVGASVWVFVDLWCPVAYLPHLLLGHVLPLVGATLIGAWLGHRLIALRAR